MVAEIGDLRELAGSPLGEQRLEADWIHGYWADLAAGEVVDLRVEQRGCDLALTVVNPRGASVVRADRPIGAAGVERVTILAAGPGRYRLQVSDAGSPGAYLLQVVGGPRPATPADRLRVAAERAFYGARATERKARSRPDLLAASAGYEEAFRLWSQAGERHGRAIAGAALGTLRYQVRDLARAEELLEEALPSLVAEGELSTAAEAHNTLGALARAAGRLDEADAHYRRAQELAGPGNNEAARYRAIQNQGVLDIYQGEIEAAIATLIEAREGWQRLGRPKDEAETLLRIGAAYLAAGDPDLAEVPLQQAQQLAERHGLRAQSAGALAELATAAWLREDWSRGEELLRRALPVFEELGAHDEQADALNSLGLIHRRQGRLEEALSEFERAATLFTARRDLAIMRMHVAWTLEGMGEAERALAIYSGLLEEFRRLGDPDLEASVHYGWGRAALALGRLEEALHHIERAISQVEGRILSFGDRSLGTAYAARKDDYYVLQVEILMCLHERDPGAGHDARAVAASERRRARQLMASLDAARTTRAPIADPELAAERDALHRRILGLEATLADTMLTEGGGSEELERELRALLADAERLESRIAAAEPRYAALAAPPDFDLARFREQLDAETEVVVVSLGERRSWLWRITRDGLVSHPLAGRDVLEELAGRAHRLLARSRERRAAEPLATVLADLGSALLGEVAPELVRERLVVVPDGALHYVPWSALPDPAGAESAGLPLLERFEIVRLPSLAVVEELRRRSAERPVPPGVLAVIADPVTESADPRLDGNAQPPPRGGSRVLSDDLGALAASLGLREFPRLPHARREAEAILGLVPSERRWSALDFGAHREAVLGAPLGDYRYLHFAVHVVPSESYPHLSGLVLSRYTAEGRRRDALLRLGDVFRLDLPVDLVVLSGCRSDGGKRLRGEGIVGLTRGFMAAGAPRVVVSLWEVNDLATAELMTRFYRGLLEEGLTPAAALRAAQRSLRAEPGWGPPYFWAGFVLQGDWR